MPEDPSTEQSTSPEVEDAVTPTDEETTEAGSSEQPAAFSAATPEVEPGASETRAAVIRLALIIAAGVIAAVITHSASTLLVVVAVIAMIMIHELGHFATAKWSGMKVTEYFLGFGPKLWSIRRGETEYGIKAIPAGGYVKIIGMNNLEPVDPDDEARTYRRQPYWQRLMVAGAGSFMHFVMAFLILVALNGVVGVPTTTLKVGSLSKLQTGASPAELAGLQLNDKLVAIDGQKLKKWDDLTAYVRTRAGVPVTLQVERGGRTLNLVATPMDRNAAVLSGGTAVLAPTKSATPIGFLGVGPREEYATVGPVAAVTESASLIWHASGQVVHLLTDRFSPSGIRSWVDQVVHARRISAERAPNAGPTSDDNTRFVSPVGIVGVAHDAANAGIRPVLGLLFSLNVFIGIFNMIPLLPFDGGHVAVATYERVRSRKGRRYNVDFAKLLPVSYAVLFILAAMGLSALWVDIVNPLPDPFQ